LVDCRAKPVSAFRDSVVGNSTRHQVKRYQAARVRTGVTATALRNAIDADHLSGRSLLPSPCERTGRADEA
jgi:hypothetical protein